MVCHKADERLFYTFSACNILVLGIQIYGASQPAWSEKCMIAALRRGDQVSLSSTLAQIIFA